MQFAIMGVLECREGDRVVDVPGSRVRRLAVRLAVDADTSVSSSELVDAIWPDDPPGNVTNALQSLVSRLRRALGSADLIQQTPQGYRLAVSRDEVDAYCSLTSSDRDGRSCAPTGLLRRRRPSALRCDCGEAS